MKKLLLPILTGLTILQLTAQDENLKEIQPIIIPINNESQEYATKLARTVGGLVAFGAAIATGIYVHKYYDFTTLEEAGFAFGSAVATGVPSYMATESYAIYKTLEKQYERTINEQIYAHNRAISLHKATSLSHNDRIKLQNLATSYTDPQKRSELYEYILNHKENLKKQQKSPIVTSVSFLEEKSALLEKTYNAATTINPYNIDLCSDTTNDKKEVFNSIARTIEENKKTLLAQSELISTNDIHDCTQKIKQMSEYTTELTREELIKEYKQLKKSEETIRYKLARLAALHGRIFSQADLTHNFGEYLLHTLTTDYPNTTQGRAKKNAEIKEIKDSINKSMQQYQIKALTYSNKVITHNSNLMEIPQEIKEFTKKYSSDAQSLYTGYRANTKLLEYNNYLNCNNANLFATWLDSLFE